ncbi:SusC/RagA family TonB-linked outer membrane protein [Echinicola sp. 20G]|uniref:SusC/RagA family TonB-linked outer membrane protein n=1 Tax=Echinicola sp. 20G TaxID=2781961 RepID=UPI0019104ECC|nr:SusC/RagA family TonB-linked outer membrane protein [Echinicola sp. 20G]
MKKRVQLTLLLCLFLQFSFAQTASVRGTVTSADNGEPIPGVSILVKGTSKGAVTDLDGKYTLSVPSEGKILIFSFIGMTTQEVTIGDQSVIDVALVSDAEELSEVVVTALGIEREERSLGYSVQEVTGDEVSKAKESSFISSLSGKVAGLSIKKSNSIGGSVNAVIRGSNSFTGNNQALFVVDGVPISNSNLNTSGQMSGGGGYDYGNAASDIDPETIESISVLKGATAAALYGSDAVNGVIMITTKKGAKKKNGLGVTLGHSTNFSVVDKSTFPKYQNKYGQGYGPYYGETGGFYDTDVNGDGELDLEVPAGEDASFGAAYDPNLMVYGWESFYPELDTYLTPSPWVAAQNGPDYIFQTGVGNITNVGLEGGNENGSVRFGYTNDDRSGILPNSKIKRNVVDIHANYRLSDKLSIDGKATYTRVEGKGRYGTGYDGKNVIQGLRQWFGTNVDLKAQEDAYNMTGSNITWNPLGSDDTSPHYFDNPYWTLFENYQNDQRNRFFGKFQANYEITDWLTAMARFGIDSYSDLQEERIAVGSLDQSEYSKFQRTFEQYNSDFILSFDKNLNESLSLTGLLGFNIRNTRVNSTRASTNGGLVVPGIYALSNSANALEPPVESDFHIRKYGYYGQVTLGYMDMLYLDMTGRIDRASTLPEGNNSYFYPSVAGSFVFSELIESSALSFGKLRLGYASVRGAGDPYSVINTFSSATPFDGVPMFFTPDTSNNPDLKPEKTDEMEIGVEVNFLNNRIGADISVYQKNTIDQILPVEVSSATGFNYKYVNAGEMENKGVEVSLFGDAIKTPDFSWRVNVNWAKNVNKVVSLYEGGENLLIYSAWSTAINARKGEAYGTITGTNYIFDESGQKVVGSDGKYLRTESTNEVIGNIQPDWIGGINNTFKYKGLAFSFLIDMQKGGDVISYDMGFGNATGLYAETAALNELGNPMRDPVTNDATSGGIILPGVTGDVAFNDDGSYTVTNSAPNDIRANAGDYLTPLGYYGGSSETGTYAPDAALVYDASFVKLREVSLMYDLPTRFFDNLFINQVSVGGFGRNLWIIHKNLPYSDPEYSASSGNLQGIQNGALPATREFGFNVNVKF